jgi:hypothetical protein
LPFAEPPRILGDSAGRILISSSSAPGAEVSSVPIVHRAGAWPRVRPWLTALGATAVLLAAFAAPTLARDHDAGGGAAEVAGTGLDRLGRLADAAVVPRVARPTTAIRFSISWHGADPPRAVRVVIDGRARTMSTGRVDRERQTFGYALDLSLSVGRHRVGFLATATDGRQVTLAAGTVLVRSGGLSPGGGIGPGDSGHGATSGTGDAGTGQASNAPSDADKNAGGGGSVKGAGGGPVAPAAGPTSGPAGSAAQPGDLATDPLDGPAAGPSVDPAAAVGPPLPLTPGVDPGSGLEARLDGDANARGSAHLGAINLDASVGLGLLGPADDPFDRAFRAVPVLISTGGSATIWAAFLVFGKRRRDGDPPAPDPVLAAHAAAAPEPIPTASLIPPPASSGLPIPPGIDPSEAGLPRWRRPSLLQARKVDPLRTASTAVSLTFEPRAAESATGTERRRIRYRLVRLLDVPDEVRATEIGILDAGDEVDILDSWGTYRLVGCPDGQQGWLHRMVLGDLVEDPSEEDAPDGIDEDVLAAFLATRQKTA